MKLLEPLEPSNNTDRALHLYIRLGRSVTHGSTRISDVVYVDKNNSYAAWHHDLDFQVIDYNKHIQVINYLLYLSTVNRR